jgi:hypothetical protein
MDGLGGGNGAKEPGNLRVTLLVGLPGKGQQPEVGLGLPHESGFHIPACRFSHGHILSALVVPARPAGTDIVEVLNLF